MYFQIGDAERHSYQDVDKEVRMGDSDLLGRQLVAGEGISLVLDGRGPSEGVRNGERKILL